MEFLMIGTFWFWILMALAVGVIIFAVEVRDDGGSIAPTLVLASTLTLLYFFGAKEEIGSLFSYIVHNPLVIVIVFLVYVIAGTGWSIAKWWFYLKEEYRKFKIRCNGSSSLQNAESWRPKASNEKSRIMGWMFYWPFSALWTFINDPIKKAFRGMFNYLESTYDNMSKNIFKNIEIEETKSKKN